MTEEQIQRYARHILLSEVGREGQEHLLSSAVRIVGDGPAAEEAAKYLAAAGIGTLVLDPHLADSLGADLATMNADAQVVPGAPVQRTVEPRDPAERLAGARAALGTLVDLLGGPGSQSTGTGEASP